jgi:iron complex transport system substrate-binding protein
MGPRFAAYLDVIDMMVGAEDCDIDSMTVRRDYSPVYHDEMKVLPSMGPGGGSGENKRRQNGERPL